MNLLVTGGLGFIGSHFVRHALTTKNWSVVNLDKQTYSGNPDNLRDIETNPRYRWVKGDIVEKDVVRPLMDAADVVVHFAAETHVDRSILDPQVFLKTNVLGTHTLLEAAKERKITRFIHVSTDEVYGSVSTGESLETDALLPNSAYAASKAASDILVRSYHQTFHLPTVITRCSNNFGPYQYPEKALPLLITNALEGKPFPLYGRGDNIRDWLYVEDHVKALVTIIEKGSVGETYNIGGTCSISNRELFTLILNTMGKSPDLLQIVTDRPGHDFRYALNCDKLLCLGWKPTTSFPDALQSTIAWYSERTDWWRPIKHGKDFQQYYQHQYTQRS
ncbi:MAG: dTDP-glucose 4,6-dehydratase [Deltaproteobacteria bacterium]|nr:dTDP-glucose 4,6-dehydratase [Deltaproteobacteria bacterium]